MATHATITFSQPGVQPPVYVTSSLSGWTPLEMDVAHDKTASGDLIFTKDFVNVSQGSYQYKVRLGEDHWILDESKETATDDQGIRNNVIHVESASHQPPPSALSEASNPPAAPPQELALKRFDERKDSTMDQDDLPTASVDAGHDGGKAKFDSPVEPDALKLPNVPVVVLDKLDGGSAQELDASEDPAAQKVAHKVRAADALPDKVNIVPQDHAEPGKDENQEAPLFRHEYFQAGQPPSSHPVGTIEEESTLSSADHTSSGDAMDTPSEADEGDELNLMPLLSHETALTHENNGLANGSLFDHEEEPEHRDIHEAPLLPHESSLLDDTAVTTDSDGVDELDRFPLLAHEGRSSGFRESMVAAKSSHPAGELQNRGPFDDDDEEEELGNHTEADDGDAPLLPHEREAQVHDNISSHSSKDYAPVPTEKRPDFGQEVDGTRSLFGGSRRYDFFKTRKNSSLPHRIPPSDAEDEDLNDPSLERFPTNRDLILQRVASIGAELPEDETTHGHHPNSPQPSVFSQACSSVDLVPVKSYTSLASVPEADDSDEEEEEDSHSHHDVDSLPSPIYLGRKSLRMSNRPSAFSRDPNATPVMRASRQLGDIMHATESSDEAESNNGHDGVKDTPDAVGLWREATSMPDRNVTSSATSDDNATTEAPLPASNPDSELRQRRGVGEEVSHEPNPPDATVKDTTPPNDDVANAAPSMVPAQHSEKHDAMSLKHLFGAVFGDRKRASTSALVLGGVLAAYYYVSAKP